MIKKALVLSLVLAGIFWQRVSDRAGQRIIGVGGGQRKGRFTAHIERFAIAKDLRSG